MEMKYWVCKAMSIIFNATDYSHAMIIKASKAMYANGFMDERREYISTIYILSLPFAKA